VTAPDLQLSPIDATAVPRSVRVSPVHARRSERVRIEWFDPGGDDALADRFVAIGAALQGSTEGRLVDDVGTTLRRLDPAFAFYQHGFARCFVASVDGEDVGRCVASVNDRAPAGVRPHTQVGNIGLWECVDDDEVARSLLEPAQRFLEAEGCHEVVGPVDFSTWYSSCHAIGPLDMEPVLHEPATPAHYDRQWRAAGFEPVRHHATGRVDDPAIAVRATHEAASEMEAAGFTFRALRMEHFAQALDEIYDLASRGMADEPYRTPVDRQEFHELYAGRERGLDPRLVVLAFSPRGNVAGYVFAAPNHVRAARLLDGGAGGVRQRLRALHAMRRTDSAVVTSLCVADSYRGYGLGSVLVGKVHGAAIELGYARVFHLLMEEGSPAMRISQQAGATISRRYALYRRRTARGREAALRTTVREAERRALAGESGPRP
jgi:GNAT superfamily N-acetyltransferase